MGFSLSYYFETNIMAKAPAPAPKSKTIAFSKATLLAAVAASPMLKPERITIEEAGGDVFVKRMTLGEREQYFEDMKEVHGSGNSEAFIYAILNEDGTPMFTRDDVDVVKSLPPELTERVISEFNKINRFINVYAKSDAKDEESEDLKNS